jgi:hypothetical protein
MLGLHIDPHARLNEGYIDDGSDSDKGVEDWYRKAWFEEKYPGGNPLGADPSVYPFAPLPLPEGPIPTHIRLMEETKRLELAARMRGKRLRTFRDLAGSKTMTRPIPTTTKAVCESGKKRAVRSHFRVKGTIIRKRRCVGSEIAKRSEIQRDKAYEFYTKARHLEFLLDSAIQTRDTLYGVLRGVPQRGVPSRLLGKHEIPIMATKLKNSLPSTETYYSGKVREYKALLALMKSDLTRYQAQIKSLKNQ